MQGFFYRQIVISRGCKRYWRSWGSGLAGAGPGPLCPPFLSPSMVTVCRALARCRLETSERQHPGAGQSRAASLRCPPVSSPCPNPQSLLSAHYTSHHTISLALATPSIIRIAFLFTWTLSLLPSSNQWMDYYYFLCWNRLIMYVGYFLVSLILFLLSWTKIPALDWLFSNIPGDSSFKFLSKI